MDRRSGRHVGSVDELTSTWISEEETLSEARYYPELASTSQHATIFHSSEWLKVASSIVPQRVQILRVAQGQETIGVLPHVHLRRGPLRMILSPPPGLGMQYLGPLFPHLDSMKQDKRERRLDSIAGAVMQHMHSTRSRFCQMRWTPGLADARAFQWHGFETFPRYSYVLPLSDEKLMWGRLKQEARLHIKRHSEAISTAVGTDEDWSIFENRARARYTDQGLTAPLPATYIEALRAELGERLVLMVARRADEWLGAVALVRFRARLILWQGAFKGTPGLPVNDILVWNAIRFGCETGCREFELMGANTKRIAEFKAKFNPGLEFYLELRKGPTFVSNAIKLVARLRSGNP